MFDSCIHAKQNDFLFLKKISQDLKSNNIKKALCIYDNEINFHKRKIFYENCVRLKNLVPVASIRKTKSLKREIQNIKSIGFKFIKFHPRNLNIKIGNNFYIKAFKELNKTDLNILWCTFDGWSTKKLSEFNQLDFLTKLINLTKKNNILLMHSGGPNILKYYEKFRFFNRIFFDLSYTLSHYRETSIEKDIIFLLKKFDRRIICGSDFPTIKIKKFYKSLKKILKISKISKSKIKNITFENLNKIYENSH